MTQAARTIIEIDTLTLDGFSEQDGRKAAAVFEERLTELLNRHGLPEGRTAEDIAAVDLGKLPSSATTPEGLGRELAGALFQQVWL
ncbi:MAG: hypothetical protein AAGA70_04425 [Pseudomonadota bacterium]